MAAERSVGVLVFIGCDCTKKIYSRHVPAQHKTSHRFSGLGLVAKHTAHTSARNAGLRKFVELPTSWPLRVVGKLHRGVLTPKNPPTSPERRACGTPTTKTPTLFHQIQILAILQSTNHQQRTPHNQILNSRACSSCLNYIAPWPPSKLFLPARTS